jgi:hypothetical protein
MQRISFAGCIQIRDYPFNREQVAELHIAGILALTCCMEAAISLCSN